MKALGTGSRTSKFQEILEKIRKNRQNILHLYCIAKSHAADRPVSYKQFWILRLNKIIVQRWRPIIIWYRRREDRAWKDTNIDLGILELDKHSANLGQIGNKRVTCLVCELDIDLSNSKGSAKVMGKKTSLKFNMLNLDSEKKLHGLNSILTTGGVDLARQIGSCLNLVPNLVRFFYV